LTVSPEERLTSRTALEHPWFVSDVEPGVIDPSSEKGETQNLLPHLKRQFDAKKVCYTFTFFFFFFCTTRQQKCMNADFLSC
jgi:hypothetical protein